MHIKNTNFEKYTEIFYIYKIKLLYKYYKFKSFDSLQTQILYICIFLKQEEISETCVLFR